MWPLPSFHFKVTLGSVGEISFSEVSGLETEFEEITYRAGDSNDFTKLKMPGLKKVSDITLKKGIFVSDSQLWKCIIRKSKFPQNPKRSVRFSGKRTKRSVQKRKARNTQKAETKVL